MRLLESGLSPREDSHRKQRSLAEPFAWKNRVFVLEDVVILPMAPAWFHQEGFCSLLDELHDLEPLGSCHPGHYHG